MMNRLTLDPETFLRRIPGDNPSGADLRAEMSSSSRFLQVKDARACARRKERAMEVDADAPSGDDDWMEVVEASCIILTEESKDLELSAWLIEALLRIGGLSGLVAGLQIAAGLVETYWDTIHPHPDDGGNEPRLSPFIALNGADSDGLLVHPLRKIPLTAGSTPYNLWQYEQAAGLEGVSDSSRRAAKIAAGSLTMERFMESVRETPGPFFGALLGDIVAARRALDALYNAFSAHVGHDAPPAGRLRAVLQDMEDSVRSFARDKISAPERAAQTAPPEGGAGNETSCHDMAGNIQALPPARPCPEAPASREDAFRQLLEIAAYFRQREPHSPISYSLEDLVRRGGLPLHQLLEELIVDVEARNYFLLASGIKPEDPIE